MARVSILAIKISHRYATGWTDPRGLFGSNARTTPYIVEAYNSHEVMDVRYAIREAVTNELVAKGLTKEEADAMLKILPQEG